jgi:hypothetical protein
VAARNVRCRHRCAMLGFADRPYGTFLRLELHDRLTHLCLVVK